MKITLATLPQATAQQVFDQVAEHLLTQMVRSENDAGTACMYRNSQGLSCAAGCLIADEELGYIGEGSGWRGLVEAGKVPADHQSLIECLQKIHDNTLPSWWYDCLSEVAYNSNFNTTVLDRFMNASLLDAIRRLGGECDIMWRDAND